MFCPEDRIPREIFWAGFGFQVWCQMLTHLIQSSDTSLFLIDEPDIYLHSDLQRQLIGILRNLGPDVLIATHSTEIITEAEPEEIVLINKTGQSGKRLKDPSQLDDVYRLLGSNANPIMTQLAKTKRVVFVEGTDFQIISKFARKLNAAKVGNRSEFAVITVEGFNPERIRSLKKGIEATLGGKISTAAILDRDYRCDKECEAIAKECKSFCNHVHIHKRKEIENFLLSPAAFDRASQRRIADQSRRSERKQEYSSDAATFLDEYACEKKSYIMSQYLSENRRFERTNAPSTHETVVNQEALERFECLWKDVSRRLDVIPGKDALRAFNAHLQAHYGVSITSTAIIDAMRLDEIPDEMSELVSTLSEFAASDLH
jgi:predicted ATP-dependent endonuclease of OLD family